MRATASLLVAAVALATFPSRPARADDDLAEAERLKAALDYEHALAIVDRLLARGGASPAQLAQLHLLAGTLAAGLDRAALAEDHFARLLAIDPTATLPSGTSPKITAPFDAARARTVPLHVAAHLTGRVVSLDISGDPLGLVAGIDVDAIDPGGRHVEVADGHATHVELPQGTRAGEVRALDAAGNRVWVGPALGEPAPPPPPPPPAPLAVHAAPHPSLARRWTTWAALGGVALATGGFAAWRFDVAQGDWNALRAENGQHDFSQLTAVEQRARTWALGADIAFGVAAAAALATTVAYLTRPREHSLTVAVGPGSFGIAGRF